MKKVLIIIFGSIVLAAGLLLVFYPFISNYLMGLNHDSELIEQQSAVEKLNKNEIDKAFEDAYSYNKSLLGNIQLTDPFDPGYRAETDLEYEALLDVNGDSVIGSIEIPSISVNLPIYHGTDSEILLKGIGHLQRTSLPVGGKGTHSVLTGHSGLSSAALFTDIDKLKSGDVFYIHVLGKTLAYQVDRISVVKPDETNSLRIDTEKDYVTLVTCTPYGINTHRLLVRGERIPYEEAEKIVSETEKVESTWMLEYKRALLAGGAVLVIIVSTFITVRTIRLRKKRKKILIDGE